MLLKVDRKKMNENYNYYNYIEISDDKREAISPVDDTVIELLYNILNDKKIKNKNNH